VPVLHPFAALAVGGLATLTMDIGALLGSRLGIAGEGLAVPVPTCSGVGSGTWPGGASNTLTFWSRHRCRTKFPSASLPRLALWTALLRPLG